MRRYLYFALTLFLFPLAVQAQAPRCTKTLLRHVYNPQRLVVIEPCVAVTGTIVDATNGRKRDGIRHEKDGDTHGWIKLDPEFESLLNDGNENDEDGNMVFEVVCLYRVSQKTAVSACRNFQSSIKIPPVGSRVKIVGQLVEEKNHGKWREIHPVSSIVVIDR